MTDIFRQSYVLVVVSGNLMDWLAGSVIPKDWLILKIDCNIYNILYNYSRMFRSFERSIGLYAFNDRTQRQIAVIEF